MSQSLPRNAFLFDLDGTLVDSVYQHVLAWREALESEGIELSVWRIHRRIGMSGGLLTNMLLRETGLRAGSRAAPSGCARRHAEALEPPPGRDPPAARRPRAAGRAHRGRHPLGHRHQRPHGDRRPRRWRSWASPGPRAGGHPRPGETRQARSRPVPGRGRAPGRRHPDRHRWWATASGTCWPPGAPGRWASACCRAATAQEELERAGAYRVFADPADLLDHLDELGGRP